MKYIVKNVKRCFIHVLLILALFSTIFSGCTPSKDVSKNVDTPAETVSSNVDIEVITPGSHKPPGIPTDKDKDNKDNKDNVKKSVLTGLPYSGEYNPVLVIIENTPAARPQSGLINAEIVYEIMTEARITRFMAVFNDKEIKVAGPVRSLRHYYLDLVKEWNTLIAHYGASRFARDEYNRDSSIKRADGMVRTKSFWRDSSRKAPHNAYVNVEELRNEIKTKPNKFSNKFDEGYEYTGQKYSSVTLSYNSFTVNKYVYDSKLGTHLRYINDNPHTDRESGNQIKVKNVIVQYAKHSSMNTKEGHIDVELTGSGKAQYFINGTTFTGTWKKESKTSPTLFYDENNKQITLQPGNTWIQVVPLDFKLDVK